MGFESEIICNICKLFVHDPFNLPCLCLVCEEHISAKGDTIKCNKCDEVFSKSSKIKPNTIAQKLMKENLHLTSDLRSLKQLFEKMLLDSYKALNDFKLNQSNFEVEVNKTFSEIRMSIDLHREELKEKIDNIALEMIDKTKLREQLITNKLRQQYSEITSLVIDKEAQRVLHEFRDPSLLIENIKTSIEEQEINMTNLMQQIKLFNLEVGQVFSLFFKPNMSTYENTFGFLNMDPKLSKKLVSCSADNTIKIWDLETFDCIKTLKEHENQIWRLEKLPNNQFLSVCVDNYIKLWDIDLGICIQTFYDGEGDIYCLKNLNKNTFASGFGNDIKIWNMNGGKCIKTLKAHEDVVTDILFFSNGPLASCSEDKTIKIWDMEQDICTMTLEGHTDHVLCLCLFKNENLASGSRDKTIKIWDLKNGSCFITLDGHIGAILGIELEPHGELISCSEDSKIKVWNVERAECVKTLEGHTFGVNKAINYQGNSLVSSSDDNTIKIWDLEIGECTRSLVGHRNGVNYLITMYN